MTLPLFADQTQLEERLRRIFQAWVDHRAQSASTARADGPLREKSATVYQEMWHAFAAYCATRNLHITDIDTDDIETFLIIRGTGDEQRKPRTSTKRGELSARYAWRMLTLIDRVTRFHAQHEGLKANSAAHQLLQRAEYRYANASDSDPLPDYYGDAQAKRLIAMLTQIRQHDSPARPVSWKEVRDRTAVALMLGGGLAPGDVRALLISGVIIDGGRKTNLPWKLALPGNGNSPARETPLAEWAGRQLAFWLSIRAEQNIAGDFVFPSTRDGRSWSHTAYYDACKAVLAAAGMDNDSDGIFKLRHTFAVRQLSKRKSESEVARWLGFLDANSMARYRRLIPRHVDVV